MIKPKIKISQALQAQIQQLHNHCTLDEEWSGILVYKIEEGSIEDPSTLIISAEGVFPMDYGNSGYTEYDSSAVVFDMLDQYPGLDPIAGDPKVWKTGHIHSHHKMTTFFSNVDDNELRTNAKHFPFYLSLIVSYNLRYNAKIAVPFVETTRVLKLISSKVIKGRRRSAKVETKDMVEIIECEVDTNTGLMPVEEWFTTRMEVVRDEKIAKSAPKVGYRQSSTRGTDYNSNSVSQVAKLPAPVAYKFVIIRMAELMSLGLSEASAPAYTFNDCDVALPVARVEDYSAAVAAYYTTWRASGFLSQIDDDAILDCLSYFVDNQVGHTWFANTVWKNNVLKDLRILYGSESEKEQVQGSAVV